MSMSGRAAMAARRAKLEALLGLEEDEEVLDSPSPSSRGSGKSGAFFARYGSGGTISVTNNPRIKWDPFSDYDPQYTEHRGGVTKRGKTKWERT